MDKDEPVIENKSVIEDDIDIKKNLDTEK